MKDNLRANVSAFAGILLLIGIFISIEDSKIIKNLKIENATLREENSVVNIAIHQALELQLVKKGRIGVVNSLNDKQTLGIYVTFTVPEAIMSRDVVTTFIVEDHKLLREVRLVGGYDGGNYKYDGEGEIFNIINHIK